MKILTGPNLLPYNDYRSLITNSFKNFHFLLVLQVAISISSAQDDMTGQEENQTDTFYIGPCAWVLSNRKCPDADIKFYLFTRSNPEERQLIHVDDSWDTSNISTSYYNPKYPVKIIIHGKLRGFIRMSCMALYRKINVC